MRDAIVILDSWREARHADTDDVTIKFLIERAMPGDYLLTALGGTAYVYPSPTWDETTEGMPVIAGCEPIPVHVGSNGLHAFVETGITLSLTRVQFPAGRYPR